MADAKEQNDEELRKSKREQRERRKDERELRSILNNKNLMICVGSGVTIFSANKDDKDRLKWKGLIQSGFDYLKDYLPVLYKQREKDIEDAKRTLEDTTQTRMLLAVAGQLTDLLNENTGKFADWISRQFKNLYDDVEHLEILNSLKKLHERGAMLMTTNYDDLIEKHCNLKPIDKNNENWISDFNRRRIPNGVFHPHGYWEYPKHIVLNAEQYYDVKTNDSVQSALRNIFVGRTVLFVGCGGGVADPNFGPLLKWLGRLEENMMHSHYILLHKDTGLSDRESLEKLPLRPVFVADYRDIGPWLLNLLGEDGIAEGTIHDLPEASERRKFHGWLSPVDQSAFLKETYNLQEPGTKAWTEVRDMVFERWRVHSPLFLLLSGEVGCGKTILCSSIISHTQKTCRGPGYRRSRDSLTYFYCSTFDVLDAGSTVHQHDFGAFLRTAIAHLCPPKHMFPALRNLYYECTKHHPARNPTNLELQEILVGIIEQLCNPGSDHIGPDKQNPIEPGETFLVIDGLDGISLNRQDGYLSFIKKLADLKLPRLHALVTSRDKGGIRKALLRCCEWFSWRLNREIMESAVRSYVANAIDLDWQLVELPASRKRIIVERLVEQKKGCFKGVSETIQKLRQLDTVDQTKIDDILPPASDLEDEISDGPEGDHSRTEMDSGFVLRFENYGNLDRKVELAEEWLAKYDAFLEQWIDPILSETDELSGIEARPTRIALLGVGFDMKDTFIRGSLDINRIKEIKDFAGDGSLNDMNDSTGHGTHALTLLLKLAPWSEIIVARITDGPIFDDIWKAEERISQAINWTIGCQADILIMPFPLRSNLRSSLVEEVIFRAYCKNIMIVAAIGSEPHSRGFNVLARRQEVLMVHSSDGLGRRSACDPSREDGSRSISTLGECVPSSWPDDRRQVRSGTSVAAVIAGAVAATMRDWVNHIPSDGQDVIARQLRYPRRMTELLRRLMGPRIGKDGPVSHPWAYFEGIKSLDGAKELLSKILLHQ